MDAQKQYEEAVALLISGHTCDCQRCRSALATIRAAKVVVVPEGQSIGDIQAEQFQKGYTAALTAEREKARKLGEALEELTAVAESHLSHHCSRCSAATKNARATLAAWKESR